MRLRGRWFEPHQRYCDVSISKIYVIPSVKYRLNIGKVMV